MINKATFWRFNTEMQWNKSQFKKKTNFNECLAPEQPHLDSLESNFALQDDRAHSHRAGSLDCLKKRLKWMEGPGSRSDNPTESFSQEVGCCLCQKNTNTTILAACDRFWLKNGVPSHSRVWGGGARLLWLGVIRSLRLLLRWIFSRDYLVDTLGFSPDLCRRTFSDKRK